MTKRTDKKFLAITTALALLVGVVIILLLNRDHCQTLPQLVGLVVALIASIVILITLLLRNKKELEWSGQDRAYRRPSFIGLALALVGAVVVLILLLEGSLNCQAQGKGGSSALVGASPVTPSGVSAAPVCARITTLNCDEGGLVAKITWTLADTGQPYTSYTIKASPNIKATSGSLTTTVKGNPAPTIVTISGFARNTNYTFTVTATNAGGTSKPSSPSNSIGW
jgi:hypothetical protein